MIEERTVAYLDLLGFKRFVNLTSADDPILEERIGIIEKILTTFRQDAKRTSNLGTEIKIFSDNICISERYIERDKSVADNIFYLCHLLMLNQFQLVMSGHLIRGGIAIGYYYSSDITILGKALQDAHQTESEISVTPRIVAHVSFWEALAKIERLHGEQSVETIRTMFLKDVDGNYFIDYLESWQDLDASMEEVFIDHKNVIMDKIKAHLGDSKVLGKLRWIANYHNRKVSENFESQKKDYKILISSCSKTAKRQQI